MKKFLINLSIFSAIVLTLNLFVYEFAQTMYLRDYQVVPGVNFESFLFADSHGLPLGKRTEKYNVFNFSAASDSYKDIERKLKYLIENKYTIKTAYVTVDDHTLSPYRDESDNHDRSVYYTNASDFDNYYTYVTSKYTTTYLPIFQPKIRSLFKIWLTKKSISLITPVVRRHHPDSAQWVSLSVAERQRKAANRKSDQFSSKNSSETLKNTLENIITICKNNNINLVGIKFPITKAYLEELQGFSYGAEQIFIENKIPILDYKNQFINNNEYFLNQDHLNDAGGDKLIDLIFESNMHAQ